MAWRVRFHELGGPEVLRLEEVGLGPPGPGEVRLRIQAIGLNRAEVGFRQGRYLDTPDHFPAELGYEASGVVLAVGAGVAHLTPGQTVSVLPAFSMKDYGTYGDEAIVPAAAVVHRPQDADPISAAAAWMQYLTAYGALIDIAGLRAGDTIVVTAASSSVGLAAIELAGLVGARAIAVVRVPDNTDQLVAAGAARVVVTEREDVAEVVLAETGGTGAQLVFDAVAGPGVRDLARATATGGLLLIHGTLSGLPTPFPGTDTMRSLIMRSYTLFEVTRDPARLAAATAFISQGLATGRLNPVVDRIFDLTEIVDAHQYLESPQARIGKVVVTVS